VGNGLLEYKR